MEYDKETESFVTYVKELHGISTFGDTELEALDNTSEMIRGYIKSTEANHKKISLVASKLDQLKHLVGIPLDGEFANGQWQTSHSSVREVRVPPVPDRR
jgi:predicted RNase H-like HicB family nuclease